MNIWNCLYCISVIVLQQAVLAGKNLVTCTLLAVPLREQLWEKYRSNFKGTSILSKNKRDFIGKLMFDKSLIRLFISLSVFSFSCNREKNIVCAALSSSDCRGNKEIVNFFAPSSM